MLDKRQTQKILDNIVDKYGTEVQVAFPVISMMGKDGSMAPITIKTFLNNVDLMDTAIFIDSQRPVYLPYDNILYVQVVNIPGQQT